MSKKTELVQAIENQAYIEITYVNNRTRKIKPVEIRDGLVFANQHAGFSKSGHKRGLKSFEIRKVKLK